MIESQKSGRVRTRATRAMAATMDRVWSLYDRDWSLHDRDWSLHRSSVKSAWSSLFTEVWYPPSQDWSLPWSRLKSALSRWLVKSCKIHRVWKSEFYEGDKFSFFCCFWRRIRFVCGWGILPLKPSQRRHLGGGGELGWSRLPPNEIEKKNYESLYESRLKREKMHESTNSVKVLHIKCCFFFRFLNVPVALKIQKNSGPPRKSLKWPSWALWVKHYVCQIDLLETEILKIYCTEFNKLELQVCMIES